MASVSVLNLVVQSYGVFSQTNQTSPVYFLGLKGPYQCYYMLLSFVNISHIDYIKPTDCSQNSFICYILSRFNERYRKYLKMCDVS